MLSLDRRMRRGQVSLSSQDSSSLYSQAVQPAALDALQVHVQGKIIQVLQDVSKEHYIPDPPKPTKILQQAEDHLHHRRVTTLLA